MSTLEESKAGHPLSWGPTHDDYFGEGKVPFRDADAYVARPSYPDELIKSIVARCEPFGADLKLVDIGCGSGRCTSALFRALEQNRKILKKTVYGIDCDSGMLEQAKKTGLDIRWILKRVKDLPSAITDKAQVVTACSALHYCDSSEDIEAIIQTLTTDGIVIEVEGGGPLNCRIMQKLMGEPVESTDGRQGGRHDEKRKSVSKHMKWAGFEVVARQEFSTMVTYTPQTAWNDIHSSLSIQTDETRMKKSEEVWKRFFDEMHPTREVPKSFSVVVYKRRQN